MTIDRSRAGAARDRPPQVVAAWPADITPAGLALATAADAEAQRTSLELGDAAQFDAAEFAPAEHAHAHSEITGLGALAVGNNDADVPVDTTGLLHVTGATLRQALASIDAALESILNP